MEVSSDIDSVVSWTATGVSISSPRSIVEWTPPVGKSVSGSPSSVVQWTPPAGNFQVSDHSLVSWSEDDSPSLNVGSPSVEPKVFSSVAERTPSRNLVPAKRLRQQLTTTIKKKRKFSVDATVMKGI